jgi:hypothetical protein
MWQIAITGNPSSLRKASDIFSFDEDGFEIKKIDTRFYIEADIDAKNENEVRREGERIAILINGILRVVTTEKANIGLTGTKEVKRLNDDGTPSIGFITTTVQGMSTSVKATITDEDGNIESQYPDDEIKKILKTANKDETVHKVLQLSGNLDSWVNLYRMYEIIKDDVNGDDELKKISGISKAKFTLFRRTANHQDAVGLQARHGALKKEPPNKPMPLTVARNLIRKLIIQWADTKG